jgi:hypothetical protein
MTCAAKRNPIASGATPSRRAPELDVADLKFCWPAADVKRPLVAENFSYGHPPEIYARLS